MQLSTARLETIRAFSRDLAFGNEIFSQKFFIDNWEWVKDYVMVTKFVHDDHCIFKVKLFNMLAAHSCSYWTDLHVEFCKLANEHWETTECWRPEMYAHFVLHQDQVFFPATKKAYQAALKSASLIEVYTEVWGVDSPVVEIFDMWLSDKWSWLKDEISHVAIRDEGIIHMKLRNVEEAITKYHKSYPLLKSLYDSKFAK